MRCLALPGAFNAARIKPANRRRYGYYCLPVLAGAHLIGRVDLKARRTEGTLEVLSAHFERPKPAARDREALRRPLETLLRLGRAPPAGSGRVRVSMKKVWCVSCAGTKGSPARAAPQPATGGSRNAAGEAHSTARERKPDPDTPQDSWPRLCRYAQHRCHPHIARWFNRMFYGDQLTVLAEVADSTRRDRTIVWQDVVGTAERPPTGSSWLNRLEAVQTVEWSGKVLDSESTVGVITPFAAQAQLIRKLAEDRFGRSVLDDASFMCGTAEVRLFVFERAGSVHEEMCRSAH